MLIHSSSRALWRPDQLRGSSQSEELYEYLTYALRQAVGSKSTTLRYIRVFSKGMLRGANTRTRTSMVPIHQSVDYFELVD
jgi:hypothetical protein